MDNDPQSSCPLYVLVPPSRLFAAHWSFFLPDRNAAETSAGRHATGRRIHVSGDRLNGFKLEMIRDYDVRKHRAVGTRLFPIGLVPGYALRPLADAQHVEDWANIERKDEDEGGGYIDNRPVDALECLCLEVEAPGPSLNKISSSEHSGTPKGHKCEVKDCQWWVREVVRLMCVRNMLESLPNDEGEVQDPEAVVAGLPAH